MSEGTRPESSGAEVPLSEDFEKRLVAAREHIQSADELLKGGQGTLAEAHTCYDQALQALGEVSEDLPEEWKHLQAWALMNKGNLFVLEGTEETAQQALEYYDLAVERFVSIGETSKEEIYVDFGALRANQGNLLFRVMGREGLAAVATRFQEAIDIFEKLPWGENPRYRHHLIGVWYNLGNVLQWSQERLDVAVNCYQNAIDLAEGFAAETSGHYSLLAGLWLNYGNTLHLADGGKSIDKVLECYDSAIRLFGQGEVHPATPHANELATAWANRANILSLVNPEGDDLTNPQEALRSAQQALDIVGAHERQDPWSAEISLKARRARCQAYGLMMHKVDEYGEDCYHEASDEVDDALALIQLWESREMPHYRAVARRLFQLGVQIYGIRQPHFLAEFVEETLAGIPDPELQPIALQAIQQVKNGIAERRLILNGVEEGERVLALYRDLERVERSLSGD